MYKEFKKEFDEVISYSQHIDNPQTEVLLQDWLKAKTDFMQRFLKGKMTYTTPYKVNFELNAEYKQDRFNRFIEYIVNLMNIDDDDNEFLNYLSKQLSIEEFFKNSLDNSYITQDDKKIQSGTKIVKSFKYFISDQRLLTDIQNKASEIIQENKVEGYLTFSVHPLDYLSLSENACGWRSCHSLDGQYRAGNLSYMLDRSTVICYLHSGEKTKLQNFPDTVPWTNKKWRCLLHFGEGYDVVFAGRQYPFTCNSSLDIVREVFCSKLYEPSPHPIMELFGQGVWSHWHNDYVEFRQYSEHNDTDFAGIIENWYAPINHLIYAKDELIQDRANSCHYNDLLRSSCYRKPYYMFQKTTLGKVSKIIVGSAAPCVKCGSDIISDIDTMLCFHCTEDIPVNTVMCEICGCIVVEEDATYMPDGAIVCLSCYDHNTFRCEQCGRDEYDDNKYWSEELQKFICYECKREMEENSNG